MPETLDSVNLYDTMPSRQERINVFIGDEMDIMDREAARIIGSQFERPDLPVQRMAVLIPVAAHQDSGHIFHAMGEYAKQKNCEPFTIFLHLNSPIDGRDEAAVRRSYAEVQRAMKAFPNLDIRSSGSQYYDATIGKIRRDLWNGALVLANHEGLFSTGNGEVIGINHDIDTLSISPHYIARIQQFYQRRQHNADKFNMGHRPLPPVGTRVSHGVLPTHPNVGKVTQWTDNSYFQAPGHTGYEAGIVIPFSHYARRHGFRADTNTHETAWVYEKDRLKMLLGAQLITSPRRYIDRLDEHGVDGIWSADSFGSQDNCRVALRSDISFARAEELIFERLESDMEDHWLPSAVHQVLSDVEFGPLYYAEDPALLATLYERTTQSVNKQLHKAERVLRKIVGSDLLADILLDGVDSADYAKQSIELWLPRQRPKPTLVNNV